MNTCLFCEIANGSAPAHKVWEDENFLAFLDTNPINPGHTMMIPKQHVDTVFDLEEPLYSELFRVAKELAEPIKRATNAARIGVVIEGFGVSHLHVHLVPINGAGELDSIRARRATAEELTQVAVDIRNEVASADYIFRWANKKLGAAAVILNDNGHVLLVKQSYGHCNWELPGGGAESGESVIETALREVREETGLRVAAERITGVYYESATDFHHFVFLCRRLDADAKFQPDAEVTECRYWPSDALPRPISDFTIRRIEEALSGKYQLLPVDIGPRQWLD